MKRLLFSGWVFASLLLLLYSFTQVDLGLTLNQTSLWQDIQRSFQYIGYFNRPLSTYLYSGLILVFLSLYIITLRLARDGDVTKKDILRMVLIVSSILLLSYNAFSYDLFNYIFDAKIVTYYHENPYEHRALDYAGDPMLGFMHWTHRTYPYGPIWLLATVPLSFLGGQIFIITFFLFKFLAVGSFVGTAYFLGKIADKSKVISPSLAIAAFALNPLVIIESLVSGHNDIFMMFLGVVSLYYLVTQKFVLSFGFLLLSIGVKFATVFMLPAYALFFYQKKRDKVRAEMVLNVILVGMLVAVALVTYRTNFQPWYLMYIYPFAALLFRKYYIAIPTVVISFMSLWYYIPYLYIGNWDPPVPSILTGIVVSSIAVSALITLSYFLKRKNTA